MFLQRSKHGLHFVTLYLTNYYLIMKKVLCLFIFSFLLVGATQAQSKDEKEVASAVEKFNKAMVDADRKVLENITADNLSYGHSSGKVETKAEFVDAVANGPFDFLTLDAEDQTIEMAGDIAVVRHIFVSKAKNNGNPVDVRIGNVLVWQKQKGQWKLLARQAYKL